MKHTRLGRQAWQQIKERQFNPLVSEQLSDKQIAYAERLVEAAERRFGGRRVDSDIIATLFTEVNMDKLSAADCFHALNMVALCWKYGDAIVDFIRNECRAGRMADVVISGGKLRLWKVDKRTGRWSL